MNKMINIKKNKSFRAIAVLLVCLLISDTVSGTLPTLSAPLGISTIQVQSIWNPVLKEAGHEDYLQIKMELSFIMGMALKARTKEGGYVSRLNINAQLDEWLDGAQSGGRTRRLEVLTNPLVSSSSEKDKASTVQLVIGFMESKDKPKFEILLTCNSLEEATRDEKGIEVVEMPSRKTITPLAGSKAESSKTEKEFIERPLDRIPVDEIKNIFVFSDAIKIDPKVGEAVVDLWPAVTSLWRKYPDATIYVSTSFPDMFLADQFAGRIKPIPRSMSDVEKWGYNPQEWDKFLLKELGDISFKDFSQKKRMEFLIDKKIDMVLDTSVAPVHFTFTEDFKKEFPEYNQPHLLMVDSPVTLCSAMRREFMRAPVMPIYVDRQGRHYEISGYPEVMDEIAPMGVVEEAGIWLLSMGLYELLGLDVNKNNLERISLSVEESVGGLALLRKWYYEANPDMPDGSFDPARKVIVVNVYAVTQMELVSEEDWVDIIKIMMEKTKDAYFVFTRGGWMDRDIKYVERIVEKLRESSKNILLPREDIYPVINDVLGITSGLVTLDTGLSHLSSSVYDIPTAVITKKDILHWLPPRDNVFKVLARGNISREEESLLWDIGGMTDEVFKEIKRRREHLLREGVAEYSEMINGKPERRSVRVAISAAESHKERQRLDEELLREEMNFSEAKEDLVKRLAVFMSALDLGKKLHYAGAALTKLTPEIIFVDSAKQTGVNIPRFTAKLFTPGKSDKTYLLIDKTALEEVITDDGKKVFMVKDKIKEFEVFHEVFGHMLVRSLFDKFKTINKEAKTREDMKKVIEIETEEEILSWVMTFFAISKLHTQFPNLLKKELKDEVDALGIDLRDPDLEKYMSLVIHNIRYTGKLESLSSLRYRRRLIKDPTLSSRTRLNIRKEFLPEVKRVFSLEEDEWSNPDKSVPRIGKKATVEEINITSDKAEVKVRDTFDDIYSLTLDNKGRLNVKALKEKFEQMTLSFRGHRDVILEILSLLEKSPPKVYVYDALVEDLFGLASPSNNAIIIHETLLNNPIAMFHEICEYLIEEKTMRIVPDKNLNWLSIEKISLFTRVTNWLKLKDTKLLEKVFKFFKLPTDPYEVITKMPPDSRTWLERKLEDNEGKEVHYYLRSIQSNIFHSEDSYLTEWIREEQKDSEKRLVEIFSPDEISNQLFRDLEERGMIGRKVETSFLEAFREMNSEIQSRMTSEKYDRLVKAMDTMGLIAYIANRDYAAYIEDKVSDPEAINGFISLEKDRILPTLGDKQKVVNTLFDPESKIYFNSQKERVNLTGYLEDLYKGTGIKIDISVKSRSECLWDRMRNMLAGRTSKSMGHKILQLLWFTGGLEAVKNEIGPGELFDDIKHLFLGGDKFPVVTAEYNGKRIESIAIATQITDEGEVNGANGFIRKREDGRGDVISVDVNNSLNLGFPIAAAQQCIIHEIDHTIRQLVNDVIPIRRPNIFEEGAAEEASSVFIKDQSNGLKGVMPDWYGYFNKLTLFGREINIKDRGIYYTAGWLMADAFKALRGRKAYWELFYKEGDEKKVKLKVQLAEILLNRIRVYLEGRNELYEKAWNDPEILSLDRAEHTYKGLEFKNGSMGENAWRYDVYRDGEKVGDFTAIVLEGRKELLIDRFEVYEGVRRDGIGTDIAEWLFAKAREAGLEKVLFTVRERGHVDFMQRLLTDMVWVSRSDGTEKPVPIEEIDLDELFKKHSMPSFAGKIPILTETVSEVKIHRREDIQKSFKSKIEGPEFEIVDADTILKEREGNYRDIEMEMMDVASEAMPSPLRPTDDKSKRELARSNFRESLTKNNVRFAVADGKIIGFLKFSVKMIHGDDRMRRIAGRDAVLMGIIETTIVHPDWQRRKGVGRSLTDEVFSVFADYKSKEYGNSTVRHFKLSSISLPAYGYRKEHYFPRHSKEMDTGFPWWLEIKHIAKDEEREMWSTPPLPPTFYGEIHRRVSDGIYDVAYMKKIGYTDIKLAERLVEVENKAFYGDQADTVSPKRNEKMADSFKESLATGEILLAVRDNKIVGFIKFKFETDIAKASADLVGVHPDYQDRGIGYALIDEFVNMLIKNNPECQEFILQPERPDLIKKYFEKRKSNDNGERGWYLLHNYSGGISYASIHRSASQEEVKGELEISLNDDIYDAEKILAEDRTIESLAKEIARIDALSFPAKEGVVVDEAWIEEHARTFHESLKKNRIRFYVRDGEIVGYVKFNPGKYDYDASVSKIAVLPHQQGSGIGHSLLDETINIFIEENPEFEGFDLSASKPDAARGVKGNFYEGKYFLDRAKEKGTDLNWWLSYDLVEECNDVRAFIVNVHEKIIDQDDEASRKLENKLTLSHKNSRRLFSGKSSVEEYLHKISLEENAPPVDIVIDLSLIPKRDLEENMETWAYLMLSCLELNNINFILESQPNIAKGKTLPKDLEREAKNGTTVEEALSMLRSKIEEKRVFFGASEEVDRLIKERIKAERTRVEPGEKEPVEIILTSSKLLKWASDNSVELASNQYPVALEGETYLRNEGFALRNFETALTIGLMKAALVIAKRRDSLLEDPSRGELQELKRRFSQALGSLYSAINGDIIITKDTLDHMISSSSKVRLNLAISLALPPLTRMPIRSLKELHKKIQLFIQAA